MSKAILTVDLGYGDSGKGTVVDALCRKHASSLVVRYNGGAQAAHNVVCDDGRHHSFHQYGSGTFAGCHTLLSKHMLVNPRKLLEEYKQLLPKVGSAHWPRLYIDEEALVTTPWHMALNRCRESVRTQRHGSCGMGIGETMAYSLKYPDAPRAKVLGMGYEDLADAMEPVRDRLKAEASELLHMDSSEHCDVFRLREFDALIDEMMWLKRYGVDIITHAQATELIATSDTVFEGAQGILIDENHGFHPYTTWSDCTLKNAEELAKEAGAEVIQRTGIIRTYMTRHGPGPMAGELFGDGVAMPFLGVADFTEQHNSHNPWQLDWRVGMPDFVAWRYALLCNFASTGHSVDSLAITHADKLEGANTWACITEGYEIEAQNAKPTLEAREEATKRMMGPMGNHPWPNYINQEKLVWRTPLPPTMGHGFVAEAVNQLGLPVVLTSHGPKTGDKEFRHEAL